MMFDDYVQHQVKVGKKDARKEGIEKGRNEAYLAIAKRLLNKGMSNKDISDVTGLSIAKIKSIKF